MANHQLNTSGVLGTAGTLFCLAPLEEGASDQHIRECLEKAATFLSQLGFRCCMASVDVAANDGASPGGAVFLAANTAGYVNEPFFLRLFMRVARACGLDSLLYRTCGRGDGKEYNARQDCLYRTYQVMTDASWHDMNPDCKLVEESPTRTRKLKTLLDLICKITGKAPLAAASEWRPAQPPIILGAEAQLSNLALCLRQKGLYGIVAEMGFSPDILEAEKREIKPLTKKVSPSLNNIALRDLFKSGDSIYITYAGNASSAALDCFSNLLSAVGMEYLDGEYTPAAPGDILPAGRYFLAGATYEHTSAEFYWRLLENCQAVFQSLFIGRFAGNPFTSGTFAVETKTTPIPEMPGITSLREIADALYSHNVADFATFLMSKKCPELKAANLDSTGPASARQQAAPVSPVADEDFTLYCFPMKGTVPYLTPAALLGACGNYPGAYDIPVNKKGQPKWSVKFGANAVKTSPDGETEKIYLEFSQVFGPLPSKDAARYLAYDLGKILGLDFVMFQTKSGKVGRIFTNPQAGPVGREDILQTGLMNDASEWGEALGRLAGGSWQVDAHPLLGSPWPPSGFAGREARWQLSRMIAGGMKNLAPLYGGKYPDGSNEFIYGGDVNPIQVYRQMAASGNFMDFFAGGGAFYCAVVEKGQPDYAKKLHFLGSLLYQAGCVFIEAKESTQDSPAFVFAKNLLYARGEENLWDLLCECGRFLKLQFLARLSGFPFAKDTFAPLSLTLPAMGLDGALLRDKIYAGNRESIFNFNKAIDFESEPFRNNCN